MRAPLFSEQVALSAHLNEAWAKELKQQFEFAQLSPELKAPNSSSRSLRGIGASLTTVGVLSAVGVSLMLPGLPYLVLAAAAMTTVGALTYSAGVRAERVESAQLIRQLANAIARRNREGLAK